MEIFDPKEFIRKSLEYKLRDLQEIHFCILDCIYRNAKKQHAITDDNEFNPNIGQYYLPEDILVALGISGFTAHCLQICLNDLEVRGLIFNVQSNPNKKWAFALTELGLQAILKHKN